MDLNKYPKCGYGCSGAVYVSYEPCTQPAKIYCGEGGNQKYPWMVKCCEWNGTSSNEGNCVPKKGYMNNLRTKPVFFIQNLLATDCVPKT